MIYVDTSAWLAISDVRDGHHAAAIRTHSELLTGRFGRLITTDYVLDETLTLLRKRVGREPVKRFVLGLDASPSAQPIWVTPEHYRMAREMFLEQGATTWSFTDCTSFVIMRELGIRTAFSFDRDFQRAGFEVRP
jgi:predicted nucleic acid-binding protein